MLAGFSFRFQLASSAYCLFALVSRAEDADPSHRYHEDIGYQMYHFDYLFTDRGLVFKRVAMGEREKKKGSRWSQEYGRRV